jgi:hypothetical protein
MMANIHLWSYLTQFFLQWEMFDTDMYKKSQHTFYMH